MPQIKGSSNSNYLGLSGPCGEYLMAWSGELFSQGLYIHLTWLAGPLGDLFIPTGNLVESTDSLVVPKVWSSWSPRLAFPRNWLRQRHLLPAWKEERNLDLWVLVLPIKEWTLTAASLTLPGLCMLLALVQLLKEIPVQIILAFFWL